MIDNIWVFHGSMGRFSSGVFTSLEKAKNWIKQHKLSGVLTNYPLDEGAYDWAIKNDYFEVTREAHTTPVFIQKFTSGSQEHYHFEDGEIDSF